MLSCVWAQVQPLRVGQPQELSWRATGAGEPIHSVELAMVHYWILDAARFGYRTEVSPSWLTPIASPSVANIWLFTAEQIRIIIINVRSKHSQHKVASDRK